VEVLEFAPLTDTTAGLNEHDGAFEPPLIVPHESVMLPLYPLTGVSLRIEVARFPAVTGFGLKAPAVNV
jgi:hypothetical protein